jgi:2-polyprenyl-3-methyl-5-hydroxy-6-metoxy-1,4-benzoquinol methylase
VKDQYHCICCGTSSEPKVILRSKDRNEAGDIVRCPNCNLVFVSPMPHDTIISNSYVGLYSERNPPDIIDKNRVNWTRNSIKGYIRELHSLGHWPKKDFLDLGGGLGYYSEAAQAEGLNPTLVDLDPVSIAFAKEKLGLNRAFCSSIEEFAADSKSRKYDLVFLRHVIEHHKAPKSLIEAVKSLLSDDGVLIIETPNNRGIEIFFKPSTARFFLGFYRKYYKQISYFSLIRNQPYAIRPPRHLFAFRIKNLEMLLKKNDLFPIKSLDYMLGDKIYWPNIKNHTLRDIFRSLFQCKLKSFVHASLDSSLHPMRLILHRVGRSSGICVYALKET